MFPQDTEPDLPWVFWSLRPTILVWVNSIGLRPNREGTLLQPLTENWIKDLLSMAPPIRTRPSFPHNQSLPSGSFHKLLILIHQKISSVQLLSYVRLLVTPWITACQASLSITNSQSLLKLMSIESVMPSSHLILCCPLLLLSPVFPSIRVFPSESTLCMKWPKYWCFSFNISPSNEHPGRISFRLDWLDLPAVQGTLKSLFQHHSSKPSIFRHSAFFIVQLSHPYVTTGKATALTRWTFVYKIMSLFLICYLGWL